MKSNNTCSPGNFFLIASLIVFFMLLYVYAAKLYVPSQQIPVTSKIEKFNNTGNVLADHQKIVVFQGSSMPDKMPAAIQWDQYAELPTVDGTQNAPKSMFMFAYNKCSPSCCGQGSPYTCSKGCVCMTDNQFNLVGSRGYNNKKQECNANFQEV